MARRKTANNKLPPGLLSLTDDQLSAVMAGASPLPPDRRAAFLADVAAALRDQTLGDGAVHRAIRGAAAKHFDAPDLSRTRHAGKYQ
jgi:hypothetical protein